MKRYLLPLYIILFCSCSGKHPVQVDKALINTPQVVDSIVAGTIYKIALGESVIEWVCGNAVLKHHGSFQIQEGYIAGNNTQPLAGKIMIEVASLLPDDADSTQNAKLREHLLSDDFLDAQKYLWAIFQLTKVSPIEKRGTYLMIDATHSLSGNLTIKGITNNITIPAKVQFHDHQMMIETSFSIDRKKWNMNYGTDQSLKDKLIDSDIAMLIRIVAVKS
jgi:hypothetical protein